MKASQDGFGVAVGLVAGALLWLAAGAAQGAAVTWDGGGDGTSFGTAQGGANTNWSADVTPSATDTITINPSLATTVNFNTAIYSSGSSPKSINISNSGAGKTTMNVSTNFYISSSYAELPVTIGSGGEWIQTAGTFTLGTYGNATALDVRNGGAVIINNGATMMPAPNNKLFIIGATGNGSLTVDAGGQLGGGWPYLQIGSGNTGHGTVYCAGKLWGQLDIQNGTLTIASGADKCSTQPRAGHANIEVGTSSGTAVLNKNSSNSLGGDPDASTKELLRVGPNGTVNWADGDVTSNNSDNKCINGGVFNYTRATGTNVFRCGPVFQNSGTFNWTGGAGFNINSNAAVGNADFQNDGRLVLGSAAQRTLTGDLILGSNGTLAVTLGTPGATGLRVAGSSGGNITVNGTLEVTKAAGFQYNTSYDILTSSKGGSGITFVALTLPPGFSLVDNGTVDGTVTVKKNPPPSGAVISFR